MRTLWSPVRNASLSSGLRGHLERNVFLVLVLAVCLTLHAAIVRDQVVQDAWYTLLGGRTVIHSGLPHHDSWTVYSLGKQWVDEQWLGHVLLYGLWAAGGWQLASTGVIAFFFAAFAMLALNARRLGASDMAVAAVTVATYLSGIDNSVMRTQIPAYLLFAVVLALLVMDARAPTRRVYLVFPILALWANIHGSVVLGAGLVALRGLTVAGSGLLGRADPRTWAARAAVLIALPWPCTLATPYGLDIIHYYRTTVGSSTLKSFATEWGPTTLRNQPLFFILLLAAVWVVARGPGSSTPFERLALLATGFLGLYAIRYGIWFTLVAASTLPFAVDAVIRPSRGQRRVRLNVAIAVLSLAVAALSVLTIDLHSRGWFERSFPARAERVVAGTAKANPKLRIFANERYADWLMFQDPSLEGRLAYDVRFELLTASQLQSVVSFRSEIGVDWRKAARGYGLLVLSPSDDKQVVKQFERDRGTRVLFRDRYVVVLERP